MGNSGFFSSLYTQILTAVKILCLGHKFRNLGWYMNLCQTRPWWNQLESGLLTVCLVEGESQAECKSEWLNSESVLANCIATSSPIYTHGSEGSCKCKWSTVNIMLLIDIHLKVKVKLMCHAKNMRPNALEWKKQHTNTIEKEPRF